MIHFLEVLDRTLCFNAQSTVIVILVWSADLFGSVAAAASNSKNYETSALVYSILLPTIIIDCAIGLKKLSANRHFFCWCSNGNKFITDKLYQVFSFLTAHVAYGSTNKIKVV